MRYQSLTVIVLCLACWQSAVADQFSVGQIVVDEPWARALPAVSKNGAAYFKLNNVGSSSDRLVSVSSLRAAKSMIHTHVMNNNVAKMRHVPKIEIAAGESILFAPGKGFHIMMMGLTEPLVAGTSFDMELIFETAGVVQIRVAIIDGR